MPTSVARATRSTTTTALASDTLPANPAWFGPGAPKVKGGIDLVGDDYNADPTSARRTSRFRIRTRTRSTATATARTPRARRPASASWRTGTRTPARTTRRPSSGNSWIVGPGVAPKADIYAVRVFGCEGSTDVVVDAIEWAVANDMDVINMSLGSPFGAPDTPDAVASTNAARDGVIVVASSGNNGGNAYITGSPASSPGAISVAASDPTQAIPVRTSR